MLAFAGIALLLTVALAGCDGGTATATVAPPGDMTGNKAEKPTAVAPAAQRPNPQRGARTRVLSAAGDKSHDKTFDDIRFEMNLDDEFRREMLPENIEAMFGKPIRIRGFILPTAQKSGIRQFVLVRDNQECCFGPGAALYDCIFVEMNAGKTAEFSIRPVAVEGTFGLKEIRGPDGRHLAIYHLQGESVR
jgi:hypothetical protein